MSAGVKLARAGGGLGAVPATDHRYGADLGCAAGLVDPPLRCAQGLDCRHARAWLASGLRADRGRKLDGTADCRADWL